MNWTMAMTDTLYRIDKGLPTKVSRVRTHLREDVATAKGSDDNPTITPKGRKVLKAAMADKNFSVKLVKGHPTGGQNLPKVTDAGLKKIRTALAD